jgi:protein involved in polysaccharide export with SLBB domain
LITYFSRVAQFALLTLAVVLAGCANAPSEMTGGVVGVGAAKPVMATATAVPSAGALGAPPPVAGSPPAGGRGYVLAPGDKLRISVFNENEMSREYEVDSAGKVTLALIGAVQASGRTPSELQEGLREALGKGYLRNPKVSVEVSSYRPFYVIGEVTRAGEYPFKNGMNVISAVAVAGGYSYRANNTTIYIRRADEPVERAYEASNGVMVYPGDIVRVPERFF